MKKLIYIIGVLALAFTSFTVMSCDDDETYADKKDKEKRSINKFIEDNIICGPITVISEKQFIAQDSMTDTARNEFVLFEDDGIYMQIIRRGEGKSMAQMAKEQSTDSTISKVLLCRFMEYDIQNGYIACDNIFDDIGLTSELSTGNNSSTDKMLCKYTHQGRSYTASFTEGSMFRKYGSVVPKGWLKPLDYILLTRMAGKEAKVRLIVPHSSGTSDASGYVLPMYYEINYMLGL